MGEGGKNYLLALPLSGFVPDRDYFLVPAFNKYFLFVSFEINNEFRTFKNDRSQHSGFCQSAWPEYPKNPAATVDWATLQWARTHSPRCRL